MVDVRHVPMAEADPELPQDLVELEAGANRCAIT
jgi:hypothetical protein